MMRMPLQMELKCNLLTNRHVNILKLVPQIAETIRTTVFIKLKYTPL